MKRIIVVLGKICSGKDTFATTLVHHTQVDIGSIVREIKQQEERVHDKTLDEQIIKELEYRLDFFKDNFVITGIRQPSILQFLVENYKEDLELIWLEVPNEELKRRFLCRQNIKDLGMIFEDVIQRDGQLGLDEIEGIIKNNPESFIIIKNY